jgi:hypothetical protein
MLDDVQRALNSALAQAGDGGTSADVEGELRHLDRKSISLELFEEITGTDDISGELARLLELPEFEGIDLKSIRVVLEFRDAWRNVEGHEVQVHGRIQPARRVDIDAGAKPFTAYLNLPWLLASRDDRAAGLHALLCSVQISDGKPSKRAPDIVAHAPHLARYGLPVQTPQAAMAVAHVVAHPATAARMQGFGFDPVSGQGLFWDAKPLPEQREKVKVSRA